MTLPSNLKPEKARIPAALKDAYAKHGDTVESIDQLAAIAGMHPAEVDAVLRDDDASKELEAYKARMEASGELLPHRAVDALGLVIKTVHDQLKAGVDGFEAAELSKPLIRIYEIAKRAEAAHKESGPLVVIDINDSFMTKFGLMKPIPNHIPATFNADEVVDATPRLSADDALVSDRSNLAPAMDLMEAFDPVNFKLEGDE